MSSKLAEGAERAASVQKSGKFSSVHCGQCTSNVGVAKNGATISQRIGVTK